MEYLLPIGVAVVLIALVVRWLKAAREAQLRERIQTEVAAFVRRLKSQKRLNPVESRAILKQGEVAFYSEQAKLLETRAVRHFQSRSTGVRIVRGVYLGSSRGKATSSQEWTEVDLGELVITNKRVIFSGLKGGRNVPLGNIIAAEPSLDCVQITSSTRQKTMVFSSSNPFVLSLVLRICAQVEDPQNLDGVDLDISVF